MALLPVQEALSLPARVSILRTRRPAGEAVLREFCTAGRVAPGRRGCRFPRSWEKWQNSHSSRIHAALRRAAGSLCEFFAAFSKGRFRPPAPLLLQVPVDGLHSIENKSHKIVIVFLTLFPDAVKHTRSLTVSKVFPVGGESGAQTSSLRPSTELEVISESGNGSCWRPGTAVPRREGESSCISFSARRCREGTKSGACKGGRACGAQLLRCLIAARQSSRAPDAIRRMGSQVALTSPTACQPQTGRPADGRHPAVSLRGAVRVYSELLVEANRIL